MKNYITKSEFVAYLDSEEKYKKSVENNTEKTPEMAAGSKIHELYENLSTYQYVENGQLRFETDRIPSRIRGDEIIREKGMIKNLFDIEKQRWRKIADSGKDPKDFFPPVMREESIFYEGGGMMGIPDAVYRNLDGGFTVVDLKSEFYSDYHKEEIAFYKKLVEEEYGMNVTEGVLIAVSDDLDRGNRVRSYNQQELESLDIEKKVKEVKRKINSNPELPNYAGVE